jgi:hypothetical protein
MNGIRKIGLFTLSAILVMGWGTYAFAGLPGDLPRAIAMERIQVPFVENRGQVHEYVAYYAQTLGGTFYVTSDGEMVLAIPGKEGSFPGALLTERLKVGNTLTPRGQTLSRTRVNIYSGSQPEKWQKGLDTYRSLTLGEVYEGIKLELKAFNKSIEKVFHVQPNMDPSQIRIQIRGAKDLAVGKDGSLIAETEHGPVVYSAPRAYQDGEGSIRSVAIAYDVNGNSYGFRVGNYDRDLELVIDPLLQSTYVGGMGFDSVNAVKIHPATGKIYICGSTNSVGFGPLYVDQGNSDAYVARLDAALTSFEVVTRLGGSGNDSCKDLRVDATAGRVFLMGSTDSNDFYTESPAQGTIGGGTDSFAAYLGTDLTLGSATYLGGSGLETPVEMALNEATGDLYLVGDTDSPDFPTTAGAPQQTLNLGGTIPGVGDGYVIRYNSDLTVQMATYLGGSVRERLGGVSIHPTSGDVYVAGDTNSTNLPGTSGGAQPANAGIYDAFVARYNSAVTGTPQTTYLGSLSGSEWEVDIEIHPFTGKIFLMGLTNSTFSDFPVVKAVQPDFGGQNADLFAAILNTALSTVEAATYLGGDKTEEDFHLDLTSGDVYIAARTNSSGFASTDFATGGLFVASLSSSLTTLNRKVYVGGFSGSGLQVNPANGDLYLAGSTGNGLPGTTGGAQPAYGGTYDAFVMRLNPDLTSIVQATYLGGSDDDRSTSISNPLLAIHPLSDDIYIVGSTSPFGMNTYVGDFPGTSGGAQDTHGGLSDGFVAYFDPTLTAASGTTCTDNDGDGYGASGTDLSECPSSTTVEDCDDGDSDNYPGNVEVCDGFDNDCDEAVDEGLTFDGDGDGYTSEDSCEGSKDDCDDGNASVNPGAIEICNSIDDDCSGVADDGLDTYPYYPDIDEDGYGREGIPVQLCYETAPQYYSTIDSDCNDGDATINPDAAEVCDDGQDDDCDGNTDCDDADCDNQMYCLMRMTPSEYDFGQVEIGESEFVIAYIENFSDYTYTITDIYTIGVTGGEENWTLSGLPALPFSLDPGGSSPGVGVTFVPQEEFSFQVRIAVDFLRRRWRWRRWL